MRALLANMGFLSQMAGIFMIIPIITSFIYKETNATVALLITAIIFLVLGFFLNALCERKELNFKNSSRLFVLSFILLSVIGSIPYIYVNASNNPNLIGRVTDSVFESVSGYTTTGFSVISNPDMIAKSIILYRGLTQFIGGIGIILILLVFFYSEDRLDNMSRSFGFEKNGKIKQTFALIAIVYTSIVLIIGLIAYLGGFKDIAVLLSYLFSAVSSGGFSPATNIAPQIVGTSFGYLLIAAMILGASNLAVIAGLVIFKFKDFIKSEIPVFLGILLASVLFVKFMYQLPFFDTFFHVASAATNTGFQYVSLAQLPDGLKLFLIVLMMVGGTSLSAAGGVKIYRVGLIFKSIWKSIHDTITLEDKRIKVFGKEYTNHEIVQNFVVVVLMFGTAFFSAILLQSGGFSFTDSLFTTSSAIATTGLDVGVIGPSLSFGFKWMISFLMLLGRVEIFAFLIIFSRVKEKEKAVC